MLLKISGMKKIYIFCAEFLNKNELYNYKINYMLSFLRSLIIAFIEKC